MSPWRHARRASTSSASWALSRSVRPSRAVVQRSRTAQPVQCRANTALSAAVTDGVAGGAGGGAAGVVDDEVVSAEAAGVGGGPRLDGEAVVALTQPGPGLARAIGGVGQHLAAGRLAGHELDTDAAVGSVAGTEALAADEPGDRFDDDVGLVAVAVVMDGLVHVTG